jgi:serine/threonine-protein kinase
VFSGGEPSVQTRTGQIIGTPQYMSPEQACGKAAGPATDVYSLGVILYEVASGKVPFAGDSALEVLTKHLSAEPSPPSALAPERKIGPELDRLILAMMSKDAAARPSIGQVAEALGNPGVALVNSTVPPSGSVASSGPRKAVVAPATPLAATPAAATAAPAARGPSRRGLWMGIAGVLVAAAGLAVFWIARPRSTDGAPTGGATAGGPAGAVTPAAVVGAPETRASAERAPLETVLVDSIPVGARILKDGQPIGTTPEAVKVRSGEAEHVVLHKDGFADRELTIDPKQGAKLVIKLQRADASHASHASREPGASSRGEHKGDARADARDTSAPRADTPSASAPASTSAPASASAPAPTAPPPAHHEPHDPLTQRLDAEIRTVAPGSHRVHTFSGSGPRTDWFVQLDGRRCYTFVGTVENGGLYMYLWGPAGHRLVDHRARTQTGAMNWCTQFPGSYHIQGKLAGGAGAYKVAVYTR